MRETMKVIKNEKDYDIALKRISELMDVDPDIGTKEADELEVLGILVEKYEDEKYQMELPDPVEAIRFEMDQRGLSPRDLIPFIGSRSKVSEVLNSITPLSLKMIRSLHKGLGIPAEILLQDHQAKLPERIEFAKYPIKEMVTRDYFEGFKGDLKKAKEKGEELIRAFIITTAFPQNKAVLYKKNFRGSPKNDLHALSVWQMQAWSLANQVETSFDNHSLNLDSEWFDNLIRLSRFKNGPLLAQEYLNDSGIALVTLKHFSKTYLDGAAMKRKDGKHAVVLTLRYDRLDNFWFVLVHELAHIKLHIQPNNGDDFYLDDLDISGNQQEDEADQLSTGILIPPQYSDVLPTLKTADHIRSFSKKIGRHPSIIAGRIRRDRQNYRIFSNLVGNREVRVLFDGF